jgi:O-methyltransferase
MKLRGAKGGLSYRVRRASYPVRRAMANALYSPEPQWPVWPDAGADALEAVAKVRDASMIPNRGLAALYQQAVHVERLGLSGAVVECGVWHGGAAALMAVANLNHGSSRRRFHLFDSFCGIPQPIDGIDGTRALEVVHGNAKREAGGPIEVGYDYSEHGGPGSPGSVHALFAGLGYPVDFVDIHMGWFQDCVPPQAPLIGPIAMLHLDGDWYESTKVCLQHLYENRQIGRAPATRQGPLHPAQIRSAPLAVLSNLS